MNEVADETKNEDEDGDEDDDEVIVPSLPAFIVIDLKAPGIGSEFKKTLEKRHYAKFEVSSGMLMGEFRLRLRDFFSEWQELKPSTSDGGGGSGGGGGGGGKKAAKKGGKEKEPVKLVAPEPQRCATGRRIWGDGVRLGQVVSNFGGGGDWRSGDGEYAQVRLPWDGFGTELFRYGPVVVVLDSAELQEPDLDALDAAKAEAIAAELAAVAANNDDDDDESVDSTMAKRRKQGKGKKVMQVAGPRHMGVRTAGGWGAAGGVSHLIPEKHPDNVAVTPVLVMASTTRGGGGKAGGGSRGKVAPAPAAGTPRGAILPTRLANKMRPVLGLDQARVDLSDRGLGLRAPGEGGGLPTQ
jgi:hypothetical protein